MRKVLNSLFGLSLVLLVVCGIAGFAGSASAQQCFVEVCKSAPGAPSDLGFIINFSGDEFKPFSVELFDGADCYTESLFVQQGVLEITEDLTEGWPLLDVVCEGSSDVIITSISDGIEVECDTSAEASITCTFVNGQPLTNIPTLSEWGMIAAAAGLAVVGVFFAMRRKRLQASA